MAKKVSAKIVFIFEIPKILAFFRNEILKNGNFCGY